MAVSQRKLSRGMPSSRKLSRRELLAGGIAGAFGLVGGELLTEPNRIQVVHQRVAIKGLPEPFRGYRVGVMSDMHWGDSIDMTYMYRACNALLELKPDVICFPGDFIHGRDRKTKVLPRLDGVLESLDAPDGVFGVLGNHDHWTGEKYSIQQIEDHSRVQLIDNRSKVIERKGKLLAIGGVGDLWEGKVLLSQAFKGVSPDVPRILLSHNPDTAQAMDDRDTRVDLQISGHTHGGQIFVPGIVDLTTRVSQYGSKFNRGLVQGARHQVFVSKGIGRPHGMRLFAPPDVVCLHLIPA